MTDFEKELLHQVTLIQLHLAQTALCASVRLPNEKGNLESIKGYGEAVAAINKVFLFGDQNADT